MMITAKPILPGKQCVGAKQVQRYIIEGFVERCIATPDNDECNACLRSLSRDSSMASRQNTMTEPQESQDAPPTENNTTNCTNSQAVNNTAANKQDKAMEQHARKQSNAAAAAPSRISTSPPESLDPALDPSSLPPPDPSLETGNCSAQGDAVQSSTPACLRDGNWFLKLLQAETARMEGWCQQMEQETKDNKLSEEGELSGGAAVVAAAHISLDDAVQLPFEL